MLGFYGCLFSRLHLDRKAKAIITRNINSLIIDKIVLNHFKNILINDDNIQKPFFYSLIISFNRKFG